MKQVYLVTGYDPKSDRLLREYDIDEEAFWALRGRYVLRQHDDGWGALLLKPDDIRLLVNPDDIDKFEWFVESMVDDGDTHP